MHCSKMCTLARFLFPFSLFLFPLAHAAQKDDAAAWARENIAAGKYAEAEALLREALRNATWEVAPPKLAQGSAEQRNATFALIEALRIQGKLKDAQDSCDALLKAKADDSAAILLRAELDCETGNYSKAREAYDGVIAREPANERAWALRSILLRTLGDVQGLKKTADHFFDLYEAKKQYFNSDEVKDPLELAYVGLGFQQEDPKSAFETAYLIAEELVQARKSDAPEVYLWSARLAHEKYHFGFANQRYKALLQMRPRLPDALAGQAAIILQTMHKLDDVEKLLKEALSVNPHHVESHLLYAELQLEEDSFAEAKQHIDAALAVNPNDLQGLALLAFYYLDMAQPEKVAEIEKRALALNPRCADFYCDVAEMMENKRGFNLAPEYYKKAVACDPDYWRGYYGLGMSTSRQGAQGEEEGKVLLNKAFSKNKFNVWANNMLKALDQIVGAKPALGDPGSQAPAYAEIKTKHFTLKCFGKEASIVRPYLEEWAELAYERQKKLFGFEPQGPLTIELCHDMRIQAARTVGLPDLGALGVCFGKLCTVVSPQEAKGGNQPPFDWRKVLEHEFGHVMALQLSSFRVPRWYTEALSTYLEEDSRLQSDPMLIDAIAKGKLKSLEHMNEYFRGNPLMAYVHGRYVMEYLAKNFGFETHVKALKLFAAGKKLAEVLPQVTGKTMQELDAGQLVFLKESLKELRPRPATDPAGLTLLEVAANKENAPAQAIADLAVARYAKRDAELAESLARKALGKDPKCVDALTLLGHLAYDRKDYEAAKQRYLEVAAQASQFAPGTQESLRCFPAWLRLGALYKKEGKTTQAVEAFETARKIHPRYVGTDNPYHELPELYEALNPPQPIKALAVWRDCVRINPEDAEAALKGLQAAMKLKDYKAALELAGAHIEVDPYKGEVHRLAGQAAVAIKDYAAAARELGVAVALDDKDVESWVSLARARKELGQIDAARQAVRQALDVDGTCKEAKALLGELK